jgi:hypothetical protein
LSQAHFLFPGLVSGIQMLSSKSKITLTPDSNAFFSKVELPKKEASL